MNFIKIIGASGLVGEELLFLLKKEGHQPSDLTIYSRQDAYDFERGDVVFLCTPAEVSKVITPLALSKGATVIDLSSAYRQLESSCLFHPCLDLSIDNHRLFSIPNCIVAIMLCVLAPLHKSSKISRIFAATYQAASGAGKEGLLELIENRPPSKFPYPLAYNLFIHEDAKVEEKKIIEELTRFLSPQAPGVHIRSIRVPVVRAHSMALNVTFEKDLSPEQATSILLDSPFVEMHPNPTPKLAEGKEKILCGPIRRDPTLPNTLDFWLSGDQLLRGAALTALDCYKALKRIAVSGR